MTLLEYNKLILEKVSFCPNLFKKELKKALRNTDKNDSSSLIFWCRERFEKVKIWKNIKKQQK
jgi:hypothetical protein